MTDDTTGAILDGCRWAFGSASEGEADLRYRAEFLSNADWRRERVGHALEKELMACENYAISVAFVSMSGWTTLAQALKNADEAGKKGRLLTTDYLMFTDPAALRRLSLLKHLEVRLFCTEAGQGFHTKGYLFHSGDVCRIILGSSNLTQAALLQSNEWNARLVSHRDGAFARRIAEEFEALWTAENTRPLSEVIDRYEAQYAANRRHRPSVRAAKLLTPSVQAPKLTPNAMQAAFVRKLLSIVASGESRALLISATGTGKTYAAAFATRRLAPRRVLFLVHREQIARQAMASFARVLGNDKRFALYTGTRKDEGCESADLVFATMQTLSLEHHAERFAPDHFDLIIIDEVHRAGAPSYQTIMARWTPRFWLGMTASPDRADGFDIYALFHHNIAADIRLQTAMAENLLCPFHYFGVADVTLVDGDRLEDVKDARRIPLGQRVNYILEKAHFYGFSGPRVKGLIFCSGNAEAQALSDEFNRRGLATLALSGADSQEKRSAAVRRLTQDEGADSLDYLFSVDIFNEGVDIPEVNQVIFLRPTESAVIFVQQLGRGLRKSPGKEFVVIIDFIANYQNNFLIPVALSGDNTYIKNRMRKFIHTDKDYLPGASTIHFDPIAEQTIYRLIDTARTNDLSILKTSYAILKRKLGRIPALTDFDEHGEIDPCKFFDHASFGSYHAFLMKHEPDYTVRLSERAEKRLVFLSRTIGHGKRPSEALVLDDILSGHYEDLDRRLAERLRSDYGFEASPAHTGNVMTVLAGRFVKTAREAELLADAAVLEETGEGIRVRDDFLDELGHGGFRRHLEELIGFVKARYRARYARRYRETLFTLNETYTYEDVCRLLDWPRQLSGQNIGGYFYEKTTKTLPVFINYEKNDEAIQYEDRFQSADELIALSKTKRRPDSPDATHIFKRSPEDAANRIYLFVRRNKDDKEAKAFYFLGEVTADDQIGPVPHTLPASDPNGKPVNVFEIHYRLETPVSSDLYHYLTEGNL